MRRIVGRTIAGLGVALLVLRPATAEFIRFQLHEELGAPRTNEPVVIPAGEVLRRTECRPIAVASLRLVGPDDQPIAVQIDERDAGPSWAEAPNGLLDDNDEIVFLTTIPKNSSAVYRLQYDTTGTDSQQHRTDLSVTRIPPAQFKRHGYDVAVENSVFRIGIRAADSADAEQRELRKTTCRREGAIVSLHIGRTPMRHVHFPYTNFQQDRNLPWDGLHMANCGLVRATVVAVKRLSGLYRHCEGEWSVSWSDEARAEGKLYRSFTVYSNGPILDIDDHFDVRGVGDNFTMNYHFTMAPPSPSGQDWEQSRAFLHATPDGVAVTRYERGRNTGRSLAEAERRFGWIAIQDQASRLGLAISYSPESCYQTYWSLWTPWVKPRAATNPYTAAHVYVGTYNRDVLANGSGRNHFRLWVLDGQTPGQIATTQRAQVHYPLSGTLTWSAPYTDADAPAPIEEVAPQSTALFEEADAVLAQLKERFAKHRYTLATKVSRHTLEELTKRRKQIELHKGAGPADERFVADSARELLTKLAKFRAGFICRRFELFEQDRAASRRGFAAFVADSLQKIRACGPIPAPAPAAAEVELARNEYESFQIVLAPGIKPVTGLTVSVSDLTGPNGALLTADTCVRRFRVYCIAPAKKGVPDADRYWPDPLIPLPGCPGFIQPDHALFPRQQDELSTLAKNELAPFWFTVYAPPDAAPGQYEGRVSFAANGRELTVPLRVRVRRFTLPDEQSLIGDIWFRNGLSFLRYYGGDVSVEEFRGLTRQLRSYRVNTQLSWLTLSQLVKVAIEPDGSYSFDFTDLDPWLGVALEHSRWFNANLGCGTGWTGHFGGVFGRRTPVLDKRTGKTTRFPEKTMPGLQVIEHPLVRQFWKAYADHLRARGWIERCYVENIDEPPYGEHAKDKPRNQFLRAFHATLRELAPELRLMNYGMNPARRYHAWAEPYVDLWGPSLSTLEYTRTELRQQADAGKPFITYVCGGLRRTLDHHTPDVYIDQPAIDLRIIPWMVYKYRANGILYYAGNGWVGDPCVEYVEQDPQRRWPASPWRFQGSGFGNGWFTYPAPRAKAIFPSVRLETIRDGLEDYEYLHLLRNLLATAPAGPAATEARELLDVGALVTTVLVWEQAPAVLRARRRQLAHTIDRLLAAADRATGLSAERRFTFRRGSTRSAGR